jgi:cation diffusion facilitator family transporter
MLGLTGLAYGLIWLNRKRNLFSLQDEKVLSIAGLISALSLMGVAIGIGWKSTHELLNEPEALQYGQALIVAIIGLIVNGLSAYILHLGHSDHDHNMRAAYLHLLADALTSMTAILALLAGHFLGWYFLDPVVGILAAIIIAKWALGLIQSSGKQVFRTNATQA